MSIDKEVLGGRIRLAREAIGLNITELGERLGYSHPVIANYEHGRRRASLEFLTALSKFTGKPLDWFFQCETPSGALPQTDPKMSRSRMEKSDSVERALLALAAALENQSKANLRQSEANLVQAGANKALAEAHKVAQERLAQRGDSPHATDRTDEEAVVGEE